MCTFKNTSLSAGPDAHVSLLVAYKMDAETRCTVYKYKIAPDYANEG